MSNSISTLLLRNLSDVFGENDPVRRRAALDELWNEDGVFYDPNKGVYRGRDEIDRIAGAIKATIRISNISPSPLPRKWVMPDGFDGYLAHPANRQITRGLISSSLATAASPLSISSSTISLSSGGVVFA